MVKVVFSMTKNRSNKSFKLDGGTPYMEGKRMGIQGQRSEHISCVYVDALGRVVGNECLDISNLM